MQPVPVRKKLETMKSYFIQLQVLKRHDSFYWYPIHTKPFPTLREDGDSGLEMRCGELESIGPAPLSDDAELCLSFTRTWEVKVLPEWENSCRNKQDLC